jgi:hypothetical protein
MSKTKESTKPVASVAVIEKNISPIITEAKKLAITSPESLEDATVTLSKLNTSLDAITTEKEKVTKPLNEALKAERNRWKPLELTLEEAITLIRDKMSVYQTKVIKEQREAEEKIASRVEKGTLKVETAVSKLQDIERPAEKIATSAGSLRFRTDKILKIVSPGDIPREYLIPDEKLILADLKAGKEVSGCVIEEVQTPINSR